jgi:hypothetical protein
MAAILMSRRGGSRLVATLSRRPCTMVQQSATASSGSTITRGSSCATQCLFASTGTFAQRSAMMQRKRISQKPSMSPPTCALASHSAAPESHWRRAMARHGKGRAVWLRSFEQTGCRTRDRSWKREDFYHRRVGRPRRSFRPFFPATAGRAG